MTLPKGFLFSQSSLQDYVDCQRRFQLRYLDHLAWPAVEAEPFLDYERLVDQGSRFHKIVRQHLIGVPEQQIERSLGGDELMQHWWNNYLSSVKDGVLQMIFTPGYKRYEEITLSTPIDEYRLVAKYDLLILTPDGKMIILDWKTSQKRSRRVWLEDRLQTRVYQFVVSHSASSLIGGDALDPDQIEMIYWFTNYPEQPERFSYSQKAYLEDSKYLADLISLINRKSEKIFPLTPDVRRCLFCIYRSLCNRGVKPGELPHLEDWQEAEPSSGDVSIDYDQINEIEF
ncbi:MAG TPA: PD-(D/E)XK nuclease family protein [Anaerolineales bacterium]